MADQRESGLTIRDYCKQSGLHENSYYYWQKKLRAMAVSELAAASEERSQELAPIMAKLNLPKSGGTEINGAESSDSVSIDLFGIRLIAGRGYPAEKLSELLRTVSRL
jgi:hypothetical protein